MLATIFKFFKTTQKPKPKTPCRTTRMEMPKYTAARAPTKKTQIHLQTSTAMLTPKAFGEKYGKLPLKAGILCWDAVKGKVGISSSIGFVKGKEGERAPITTLP